MPETPNQSLVGNKILDESIEESGVGKSRRRIYLRIVVVE
jgi:hypothetical protein